MLVRLGVALAVFAVALDGGSYGLISRHRLAIAVWSTVFATVALGVWPRQRPSRPGLVATGLLLTLALWSLASIAWTANAEGAFLEFDRVYLYVGVFVLAQLALTNADLPRFADGVALGTTAVVIVALASRLVPDFGSPPDLPRLLPAAATRLSYPLNYWNGLAALLALGIPFLLWAATANRSAVWRGAALAPLPAFAAAIFLTSSRGGTLAAVGGVGVLLAWTRRRWRMAGAVLVSAGGSSAAVGVLLAHPRVVDGPLRSGAAESQGTSTGILLIVVCIATGLLYAVACQVVRVREPSPRLASTALVLALLAAGVGLALSNPRERFDAFKQPPELGPQAPLRAHLLSAGGSGRWQFWETALDEFEAHPLEGGGAGSYEAWWARHGSFSYFVRDAHSLYLEILGELGAIGFVLLIGAFGIAIVAGMHRARDQDAAPPVLAAGLAFAVSATLDWVWEVTAVAVLGIACLALLTQADARGTERTAVGLRLGLVVAALLAIVCQAIPLFAQVRIEESQSAARAGNSIRARSQALAAQTIEPWGASPRVQLALVEEQAGRLSNARRVIHEALDRNDSDWRTWLIAARIETKLGSIDAARRALAQARELNPRSPLFAPGPG